MLEQLLEGIMDAAERKVRLDLKMKAGQADITGMRLWADFSEEDVAKAVEIERKQAVKLFWDRLYKWVSEG